MRMMIDRLLAVTLGMMAFVAGGCGCQHQPDRHPVTVTVGQGFQQVPRMIVHIFAANAQESDYWENAVPMSKYWVSGDPDRRAAEQEMFVMTFGEDKPRTQTFSPKTTPDEWNRLWEAWEKRKAVKLFILAFLPSDPAHPFEDRQGSLDARRQVLPLDRCRWEDKQQPINVVLTPAKIVVTTPPKEVEK